MFGRNVSGEMVFSLGTDSFEFRLGCWVGGNLLNFLKQTRDFEVLRGSSDGQKKYGLLIRRVSCLGRSV